MTENNTDSGVNLIDRPRGILTPDDRAFLLDEKSYANAQSARRTRARIRERVFHSIIDLKLINHLERNDIEQIAEMEETFKEEINEDSNISPFHIGIVEGYHLLYLLLRTKYDSVEKLDLNIPVFMKQAIENVEVLNGYRMEVNIDIERETLDPPNKIIEKVQDEGLQSANAAELDYLFISGKVDPGKLRSFLGEIEFEDGETIDFNEIFRYNENWKQLWGDKTLPHDITSDSDQPSE